MFWSWLIIYYIYLSLYVWFTCSSVVLSVGHVLWWFVSTPLCSGTYMLCRIRQLVESVTVSVFAGSVAVSLRIRFTGCFEHWNKLLFLKVTKTHASSNWKLGLFLSVIEKKKLEQRKLNKIDTFEIVYLYYYKAYDLTFRINQKCPAHLFDLVWYCLCLTLYLLFSHIIFIVRWSIPTVLDSR